MKNLVIMFVKEPKEGLVKTRLAKNTSTKFALDFYTYCIEDLLHMLQSFSLALYAYPKVDFFKHAHIYLQKGEHLGQKMFYAFKEQFDLGYDKVVLIGSDTPQLPSKYIKQSFKALDSCDIVLGPSEDGGYYLIALKQTSLKSELFENISWSTPIVLEQTLQKVNTNKVYLLPILNDIDTLDDLQNVCTQYHKSDLQSLEYAKGRIDEYL